METWKGLAGVKERRWASWKESCRGHQKYTLPQAACGGEITGQMQDPNVIVQTLFLKTNLKVGIKEGNV